MMHKHLQLLITGYVVLSIDTFCVLQQLFVEDTRKAEFLLDAPLVKRVVVVRIHHWHTAHFLRAYLQHGMITKLHHGCGTQSTHGSGL